MDLRKGKFRFIGFKTVILKTIQKSKSYVFLIHQVFGQTFPYKQKEWYHL